MERSPNKVTFFDVETPNSRNDKICSIGVVQIKKDGEEICRKSFLVNPQCSFEDKNISIHGLSRAICEKEPTFDFIWTKELEPLFIDSEVVAHNASFDLNVLTKTLSSYDLDLPNIQYFCTLKFSKEVLPNLSDHKLPSVCSYFGVPLNEHHDALSDALACKEIYLHMRDLRNPDAFVSNYVPCSYSPSNKLLQSEVKEITKAMTDLYGIIIGISIDGVIKPDELVALKDWRSQYTDSSLNVINDMCDLLDLVLADEVLSASERAYLLKVTRSYAESSSFSYEAVALQELIGILKGVKSDKLLNVREAQNLLDWIEDHEELLENEAIKSLKEALIEVLYDGEISDEETLFLFEKFKKIINPVCDSPQNIAFEGNIFVLSGNFLRGSKEKISRLIEERGGQISSGVSRKISYVIVGGDGSSSYNYGSYGGKVKRALELQEKGLPIEVISEDQLFSSF